MRAIRLLALAVVIFTGVILMGHPTKNVRAQDGECTAIPFEEANLPQSAGQLLYTALTAEDSNWAMFSASDNTLIIEEHPSDAVISPDGLWIAGYYWISGSGPVIRTLNTRGEIVSSIPISNSQQAAQVMWLNNLEILTVFMPQARQPEFYTYWLINPFTHERQLVAPFMLVLWHATDPLLPNDDGEFFSISPHGRYAAILPLFSDNYLYDIQEEEVIRELTTFYRPYPYSSFAWSSDAERFAFFGRTTEENAPYGIYIYDIHQDTSRLILEAPDPRPQHTDEVFELEEESWSPDGGHLAFTWHITQDEARVYLVDTSSGLLVDTCLTNLTSHYSYLRRISLHWSRDGRYLAVYGALSGQSEPETGTVYIYDVDEELVYEVHEGPAEVVGWANQADG